MAITVGYSILFSAIAAAAGVQNISWANASASEALDLIPPVILAFLTALGVNLWLGLLPLPVLLGAAVLAFSGYVVTRYRSRLVTGLVTRWVGRRGSALGMCEMVLIVGAGETGQFAAWRLSRGKALSNFQVVGFVDDDMFRQGARLNGFRILGQSRDIPRLVEEYDIGLIIFAIHRIEQGTRKSLLEHCRATGVRVVAWPDMLSILRGRGRRGLAAEEGANAEMDSLEIAEIDHLVKWLDSLEDDLHQGDYDAALKHIDLLRTSLQSKYSSKEGTP